MSENNNQSTLWSKSFILLCVGTFFSAVSFYFLIPTLPTFFKDQHHIPEGEIGFILAAYIAAATLIRPFTGYALDALGRRAIFLINMIFFAAFFNGYIFINGLVIIILQRILHGFTWGIFTTSTATIAIDIIPENRRGEGIGIYGLAMTLAMSIAPMLAWTIIGNFNYSTMFVTGCLLSFLGTIFYFNIKFVDIEPTKTKFSWKNLFEKLSLPFTYNLIFVAVTYGALLSFVGMLGKEIGIDNPGSFFMVFSVGVAISRIIAGKIFDKRGPREVITLGLFLLTIGFVVLALIKNTYGFHGSALIMGTGMGINFPVFSAMVNELAQPNRRGAANSTMATGFDLGIGFGMVLMGCLIEKVSLSFGFLVCAVLNFCALLFYIIYVNKYFYKNKLTIL